MLERLAVEADIAYTWHRPFTSESGIITDVRNDFKLDDNVVQFADLLVQVCVDLCKHNPTLDNKQLVDMIHQHLETKS